MLRLTAVESAIMEKSLGEKLARSKIAVKKLQSSTLRLVYPDLGNPGYLSYCVWRCDSCKFTQWSISRCPDSVFLCGNNKAVPITWKLKKLKRVTEDPVTSEKVALAESADAGHFVTLMTKEIFGLETAPSVFCKTDKSVEKQELKGNARP